MTKSQVTDLNAQATTATRLTDIYRAIQIIKDQGIDCYLFEQSLEKSDSGATLKQLAQIIENDLLKKDRQHQTLNFIDSLVNQTIFHVLTDSNWVTHKISPIDPVVIGAGGFSWIAQVEQGGERLALSIPKYRSDDYDKRVITRRIFSDLVPTDVGFEIPRVRQIFHAPFHAALMTVAEGQNCYKRCFDSDEKSITSDASTSVFKQLGYMAAGFSGVVGSKFGAVAEPIHYHACEHLDEKIKAVRAFILETNEPDLEPYGYNRKQLMDILEWIESDLDLCARSPQLVHADLSPWNLHHDPIRDNWTITDGDDSYFGIDGQQIGVCLISMRGNDNPNWVQAISDGYSARISIDPNDLLLRGAAYGVVSYGLYAAATAGDVTIKSWNLRAIAPLIRIFQSVNS